MIARYDQIFCIGILALSLLASAAWAAPGADAGGELNKNDLTLEELDAELAALEAELAKLDSESDIEAAAPVFDEDMQNKEDFELGEEAYSTGLLSRAVDHWTAAAQRNYAPAQSRLGMALDYTDADVPAVGWFMMAANQENAEGEFNLGQMYLSGEGVKQDMEKAAYWIRSAAERDFAPAIKVMDDAYKDPDGVGKFLGETAKDKQQAEFWANQQEVIGGAAAEAAAEKAAYEQKKYIDSFYEDPDAAKDNGE